MPRLKTILFDLDGTLIDSVRLILDSYHHTLAAHGLPARSDEEWLRGVGTPLRIQFQDWADDPAMLEQLVVTYREYNLANHDRMVTAYAGVGDMLRAIKAGGRQTGLVTSKNREGAIRGLRLVGFEEYLDILVCADEVTNPKPHREPVDKAVALLAADPTTTVYVGDSIHDMHSGRSAGVWIAAALWGPFGRQHLEPSQPDWWMERPDDLVRLLDV
jgi:pyrophosphatase PpaX